MSAPHSAPHSASKCSDCSAFAPKDEREGFCKVNGPTAQAVMVPARNIAAGGVVPELRVVTVWPSVDSADWCPKFSLAARLILQ